jgi:hypothetical protein
MPSLLARLVDLPLLMWAGTRAAAGRGADRDRAALAHRPEDAFEVLALQRQQLGEGLARGRLAVGEDHLAHRIDPLTTEEHVLGAAEADALGAEGDGLGDWSGWSALVRIFSLRTLSAHFRSLS